jgi:nucleotide-binding universal stress UspA family protein
MQVFHELPGQDAAPGVLVGVDGSDASLWALERGFAEATAFDLPLYALAGVNPVPLGWEPGLSDLVQDSIQRLVSGMTEVVTRGITAVRARSPYTGAMSLHVVAGHPVDLLLRGSVRQHTVVLGTRGNGGFSRMLLGSVANALAHHSACPVLLVPSPPGE